jgi:hypothetical protein
MIYEDDATEADQPIRETKAVETAADEEDAHEIAEPAAEERKAE